MGNTPRDYGPGGQCLGFIFICWGLFLSGGELSLVGSCPRTNKILWLADKL